MNANVVSKYWNAYGGFKALVKSPYLWTALILTAFLFPHWSNSNWWDDVLSIMPNLLGFSLGGYAMWIAIGDDNFRKLISGESQKGETSPYMEVNAAFVHFILLQMLSIILSLIAKAYYFIWSDKLSILQDYNTIIGVITFLGYFFSYFIFIYALLSAVAATLALLSVSSWYDMYQTEQINLERNLNRKQHEEQKQRLSKK